MFFYGSPRFSILKNKIPDPNDMKYNFIGRMNSVPVLIERYADDK